MSVVPAHATHIAWDLETTGLARDAEIVSIGWCTAVDPNGGTPAPERSGGEVLCLPVGAIDAGASRVHGHTAQSLRAAGAGDVRAALEAFFRVVSHTGEDVVLVAHNGKAFDTPKLRSAMLACGATLPANVHGFIDTLLWARATGEYRSCSLDSLMQHHRVVMDRAKHGALVDSRALAQVEARMLSRAGGPGGVPACAYESAEQFMARTAGAWPCPLVAAALSQSAPATSPAVDDDGDDEAAILATLDGYAW